MLNLLSDEGEGVGGFGDNMHRGGRANDDDIYLLACMDARGSWLSNAVPIVRNRSGTAKPQPFQGCVLPK